MTENQDIFLEELRAHAQDPALAELVDFHVAVRQVQLETRDQIPLRQDRIAPGDTFAQGVPLLPVDRLRIEPGLFVQTFQQIADLVSQHRPQWAIPPDVPHLALVGEWYRRGMLDDRTLSLVMQMAARPFLEREAQVTVYEQTPSLDLSQWWRGWCPLCGGLPSFSALSPPSGKRSLLCPRCLTQWSFSRVVCPFCGEDDSKQLGYYPSEDNVYRLYVCESCKGYLKTVDYREVAQRTSLPALDVLTTDMDMAAVSQGYQERGGQPTYWARVAD